MSTAGKIWITSELGYRKMIAPHEFESYERDGWMRGCKRKTTARELARILLDCSSHFYKPTITNTDPTFAFGKRAMVVCQTCVETLEELTRTPPAERAIVRNARIKRK